MSTPERPACVVAVASLVAEKRPRWTHGVGVGALVRDLRAPTGLTQMGVNLREIEPGNFGTNRHWHAVEEEWVYVLAGSGEVRIGPLRLPVRAGSFVGFPPGPRPHHFLAQGNAPLLLLEGGERRPDDYGFYPDARRRFGGGKIVDADGELPPEEGDARQCRHIDDVELRSFQHEVDPRARRVMRRLESGTGLERQRVVWSRVEAGDHSTARHTHDRTDEWVYILEGRALARVGDARFDVGPGDFIAHPAGSPAHLLEPSEPLVYLMGGQHDADDVITYPDAGVRRVQRALGADREEVAHDAHGRAAFAPADGRTASQRHAAEQLRREHRPDAPAWGSVEHDALRSGPRPGRAREARTSRRAARSRPVRAASAKIAAVASHRPT